MEKSKSCSKPPTGIYIYIYYHISHQISLLWLAINPIYYGNIKVMFSFGQCFNPGHQVEDLSSRLLRLPLKKESCMLKIHLDQTWPSKQISCKKKRRILMNSWLVRLICPQLSCQEIVSQDAVLNCQFVAPVLPNLQQFVKSWIPTASIAGIACFAVQLFKVLLTNPKKLISVVRVRICRLDIS